MLVRQLQDLEGTGNVVRGETWTSRRLLLAGDKMGFSLHDTVMETGTVTRMHYQNHLEAVYCIEGRGTIEDLKTGEVHQITPGTVYALDQHDEHILSVDERLRFVCVFNPPVVGPETHDEHGVYPLMTEA